MTSWLDDFFAAAGPSIDVAATGAINDLASIDAGGASAGAIRFTGVAPTVNGLAAGATKRRVVVMAVGGPLVLANENAGSAAANRIVTGTGANVTIQQGAAAWLAYDATSSRWRLAGGGGGFTAGGDLTGSSSSQTVAKVKGTTITTAGGALPVGAVLRTTAAGVADWGTVDLADGDAVTVPGTDGDQLIRSGGVVAGARRPIRYDDATPANYSNVKINAADVAPIDNTKSGIVNWGHNDNSLNSDGVTGNYAVCVGGNMPSITSDYAGGGGYRPNAHGMGAWAFGYSAFADGEGCFAGGRSNVAGYLVNMTGGPSLTFAEVGATGDTITRSAGSWVTEEFAPGMYIGVTGSASNNITDALITGVTATVLTLDTTDLVNEGPVVGCAVVGKTKYATTFGRQVQARAPGSFGAGYLNTIQGGAWYSVAFGYNTSISAAGLYAFAAGNQCQANANGAVAMGTTCVVANNYGVAMGYGNTVSSEGGVAIGRALTLTGAADFGFAAGYNSTISARGASALGENHSVSANRAFVHGYNVTSSRVAEYAHGAFTSGDGPAGAFRRNLLLGTSTNGATVNVLDQSGAEFALVNARSYLVRVFVLGARTDAGGRGATVHTLLVHTTGGTVTIDNDTTDYTQLGVWAVAVSVPGALTLRVACTGAAGQTVKFAARVETTELEGV